MALTGSDIWLATAGVQLVSLGMVLLRRIYCVYESAMALKSAVSFVRAAWSIRLITLGTNTAARIAMTARTPILSINVNAPAVETRVVLILIQFLYLCARAEKR